MQNKTEANNPIPSTAPPPTELDLSPQTQDILWNIANYLTIAGITSAGIITVQSPIKTLLMNKIKNGKFMPYYEGGLLSFFGALYAGTSMTVYSSATRTVYVTGTMSNTPKNSVKEEASIPTYPMRIGSVMIYSLGDMILTQVPDSLSQLKKTQNVLPKGFKWYTPHNINKLMFNGFAPRYFSSLINYTAMLQFEGSIARLLPIKDNVFRHSLSGALSGGLAAVGSYPLSVLKDYTLAQSKVNEEGYLETQNCFTVMKRLFTKFSQHPKENTKVFLSDMSKQLPLRVSLGGIIFSIVAGVGEKLGPKPLDDVFQSSNSHGFFNHKSSKMQSFNDYPPAHSDEVNPFK